MRSVLASFHTRVHTRPTVADDISDTGVSHNSVTERRDATFESYDVPDVLRPRDIIAACSRLTAAFRNVLTQYARRRPPGGGERAGRELIVSSYWDMLPSRSFPSACHSFQDFQPPQSKYRPLSDGTRYVLREKVRFFERFTYGASCVAVHEEVAVKPLAYVITKKRTHPALVVRVAPFDNKP